MSDPGEVVYKARMLLGGNYHNYDYQIAYMNTRKNAETRAKAFVAGYSSQVSR